MQDEKKIINPTVSIIIFRQGPATSEATKRTTSLSSCLPSGVTLTGFATCEASFPLFGLEEWVPLA